MRNPELVGDAHPTQWHDPRVGAVIEKIDSLDRWVTGANRAESLSELMAGLRQAGLCDPLDFLFKRRTCYQEL